MLELPSPGYTVPEVEHLLGLPHKRGYALIREGRIAGYTDRTGKMRVHPYEVWKYERDRFLKRLEEANTGA